jgi:diacylglycerol O-acyltransferase / wax synthase
VTRLSPLDLSFLLTESSSRPMHAGAVMVFDPPPGGDPVELVERITAALRAADPVAPWNRRPVLGLTSLPHWQTVTEVDLSYHVRRVSLPAPGSMEQLMELVSQLYPALLDRSRPLWEAYVVDGLERGGMAIFVKAHHALFDGASGMGVFHASMSETPDDLPRALWNVEPPRRSRPQPAGRRWELAVAGRAVRRAAGIAGAPPKLAKALPAALRLARDGGSPPFTAARTPTMSAHISPARSFATFDLPLERARAIAKRHGGTVNDVVLCVCDGAMQSYIAEVGRPAAGRMVSVLPVSTRRRGDYSGNAVAITLVALGLAKATPAQRIEQIITATDRVKAEIRRAPGFALQLQTLSLMAAMELREQLPIGRGTVPNVANLTVSNIAGGPRGALYLGQAKLAGFYVTPIVGGSQAANFTLVSYNGALRVGIGAARNLITDTPRLARLATQCFEELEASPAAGGHA